MPFLMEVEAAAARIVDGLKKERFEVTFLEALYLGHEACLLPALPRLLRADTAHHGQCGQT